MNLFLENWDYLDTTSQRFSDTGLSTPTVTAAGRRGTSCCDGSTEGHYGAYAVNASGSTVIAGVAVQFPTASGLGKVLGFGDVTASGMENVYIQAFDDGSLGLFRQGGQVLGISPPNVFAMGGPYVYIEAKITIASGVGGAAEVRVNTAPVIVLTNINTYVNGSLIPNRIWIYPQGRRRYDDMYVNDERTDFNNSFEGDVRIDTHYPESDESVAWNRNTGTTNFECVDEHPPDDDVTYNSTPTFSAVDILGLQDLIPVLAGIRSVQVLARAKSVGLPPPSGVLQSLLRIGGVDYRGVSHILSSSYKYYPTIFNGSPATASGFSDVEFDAMQVGYRKAL